MFKFEKTRSNLCYLNNFVAIDQDFDTPQAVSDIKKSPGDLCQKLLYYKYYNEELFKNLNRINFKVD